MIPTLLGIIYGGLLGYLLGAFAWFIYYDHKAQKSHGRTRIYAHAARDNVFKYPLIMGVSFCLKLHETRKKHRS